MKTIVFSSILLLGFMNFIVAELYINQTSIINIISILVAFVIAFVVYITGFDPLTSNTKSFWFILLSNLTIIGIMIGVHYTPIVDKYLFTSSKKFIDQQNEYERLLR